MSKLQALAGFVACFLAGVLIDAAFEAAPYEVALVVALLVALFVLLQRGALARREELPAFVRVEPVVRFEPSLATRRPEAARQPETHAGVFVPIARNRAPPFRAVPVRAQQPALFRHVPPLQGSPRRGVICRLCGLRFDDPRHLPHR